MIGFALCHGWSFDADSMDAFAACLKERFPSCAIASYDLGFTGTPHAPQLDAMPDTQWIALGHSYGFAYLMQLPVPWRAAISVNGFTRFCRRPGKPEGMPLRLVDAMIARLESEPRATVEEFQQRCGGVQLSQPHQTPLQQLDAPFLVTHLTQLRDLDLPMPACPVLSLSTHDDLIVPPSLTHACFGKAGCTMQEYEGSHLQLLHAPQQCMTAVAAFVEACNG
ncbi:alpha/beta hydrolase [Oxalobacteraceae bacterium R-40]|uniref:Alpha/beta hydrolase n=1 Tax=Keguizhuia sedimenti TaxID=3064264 RepID=A0ABU1BPZ7_9BURK|nr:alpha/beta hydrolase [Oxalobacteraceae bacterium R-40]